MNPHDPTARAAIQASDNDVLGWALSRLDKEQAVLVVLHHAFEVPMAKLVRQFKATRARVVPDFDYLGHVHHMVAYARWKLGELLHELGFAADDLDWHNSYAVREIGARYGVRKLYPCAHCKQPKIPAIGSLGRPPAYCSNSCRQAAYRQRCSRPVTTQDMPERGMPP